MSIRQTMLKVFGILGLAIMYACSSVPTEDEARRCFEKWDWSGWKSLLDDGAVKVKNFKKVDGQTMDFGGVKQYSLYYEAEIEVLEDIYDLFGKKIRHKKGDIVISSGSIDFEKTERGWLWDTKRGLKPIPK